MFKLKIDLKEIADLGGFLAKSNKILSKAAETAAKQTHAFILEKAQAELHSSRETYVKNLKIYNSDGFWIVELGKPALWIEEGIPDGMDMLPGFLKNGSTSKDGKRYKVIPFEQTGRPSNKTPAQNDLASTVKAELQKRRKEIKRLSMKDGAPVTGKITSFDITKKPLKTAEGPFQGSGPMGSVRQGQSGDPFLARVNVYNTPTGNAKKTHQLTAVTFRTASEIHSGSNMWRHPGFEAKKYFEEAYEWAEKEWKDKIQPMIIEAIVKDI